MMNLKYTLVLLPLFLLLAGCGDITKNEKILPSIKPIDGNCNLDIDEIGLILEKDISPTIGCLGDKLESFMDYEELGQGDSLSRTALMNFLITTQPEISARTRLIIQTVFDLNHLITGEDSQFITRAGVKQIINLAMIFNEQSFTHYDRTFRSKLPANLETHQIHRKRVVEATEKIQAALKAIYKPWRDGDTHQIVISKLLEAYIKPESTDTLEKIKGVLFAKRIILGGEPDVLTHVELGRMFTNLPKVLSLLLDGVRYEYLNLDQLANLRFVNDDLGILNEIIFEPSLGNRTNEKIFHVDEAIDGIQAFMEEPDSLTKYRALVHEGMKILTQKPPTEIFVSEEEAPGEPYYITGGDIERIVNHGFNVLGKGLAFHKMYLSDQFKPLLSSPQSLDLKAPEFAQYFPGQEAALEDFVRIANKYRFQRGNFEVAFYSKEFKRNADAFFETAAYEYVIRLAFRFYGSSLSMSLEQVLAILTKFENEFIETGILMPRRAPNTAETITLLGSLFQYQSDNNKVLDVNEATEFAVSLVTSMDMKTKLYAFFEDVGCDKDIFGRIDPLCFRQNFYKGLCTNYKSYFPRLFEYLGITSQGCNTNFINDHNNAYLDSSFKAARFCQVYPDNGEEIHYSEGDIMSIVLAMIHIETTIIRWDTNLNNQMDFEEVMKAYEIYEPAIQGMLPKLPSVLNKPGIVKALSKVVYKYLVKYEEAPNLAGSGIITTVRRLLKFNLKAPAPRKTIASILFTVSDQSKKKAEAAGTPQFDCRWLRDPDNIPRD